MAKLGQAGFVAYLVGGGVRDLMMGKTPKDFDITTSAKPEEIKRLFSNCLLIGRRFRLAHIRFGKKIIEVSTFRSGDNNDDELILRDNLFGSPEEDVLRRDFTINGLFYDPKEHAIIDFVGGTEDLEKHLLRTIGDASIRFKQDPVRMIRLLKFQARFDFNICNEVSQALQSCKEEIMKSSPARVLEEFLRMLESGASAPFLSLLNEQGFLKLILPDLVYDENAKAYLRACDQIVLQDKLHPPDRSVLLACLFFPYLLEKIETQEEASFTEIIEATEKQLHQVATTSFFAFPRRLRGLTTFILNSQFRLTPPCKKRPTRFRLARHPDYPLALQFLHLRTLVDSNLEDIYRLWKKHTFPKKEKPKKIIIHE